MSTLLLQYIAFLVKVCAVEIYKNKNKKKHLPKASTFFIKNPATLK